ncbi:MAG: phosphotransferase [Bacteriovoracaceae bacterium]|nr:phosphotransferase [Bacteriovoracaceae bacterium]
MIIGDFHIHSTFSDGKLTIPEIIDLYGQHGFGAIAITDHLCEEKAFLGKAAAYLGKTLTRATFPLYQEILKSEAERAWKMYRMLVIPGVEFTQNSIVNHRSSHILGLGLSEYISADRDIVDIARSIRAQGGLAIAAHPLSPNRMAANPYLLWDRREELRSEFDAWEITLHQTLLDDVVKSDLPKIASSDFHGMRHFHSWKTTFDCERTVESVLESIRLQKLDFTYFKEEQTLAHPITEEQFLAYPKTEELINWTPSLAFAV